MQFSREARCAAGVAPAALHDYWLREMDFTTSEAAFASPGRSRETCEYAFYPGCQLGAANPEHVLRSYDALAVGHDTGVFVSCCGAPAYWAGDAERLQRNIAETESIWRDLGSPTLVFACATCMRLFSYFHPDIPRVSLYEILCQSDAAPPADRPFSEMAVFDPCASRGDEDIQRAVRRVAQVTGIDTVELLERNRCCGHGGHISIANPTLFEEIVQNRIEAAELPYLVYCANCREVFASHGKRCAHVLDVFFGLEGDTPVPTLDQKRKNSLRVKRELMKLTRDEEFEPERHAWDDLDLVIGGELQRDLDRKLISASDLQEAVWLAETSGDVFVDETGGTRLASMIKPVITYWVEYREVGTKKYEVLNAYYHRMRFQQGE